MTWAVSAPPVGRVVDQDTPLRAGRREAVATAALSIALALGAFAVGNPAVASAKPPRVRVAVSTFKVGPSLGISLSGRFVPGGVCTGRIRAKRARARLPLVTLTRSRATFRWAVPRRAPAGRWRFILRCRKGEGVASRARVAARPWVSASASAHVRTASRKSTGPLMAPSSMYVQGAECSNAPPTVPGNPFGSYKCECTWYAAQRRTDLHLGHDEISTANPKRVQVFNGHAKYWWADARQVNVPRGQVPVAGAIAVWGGGAFGHVAYVESVHPNGRVDLSDFNFRNDHKYRWHRAVDPRAMGRFLGYIYGGPGPGAAGMAPPPTRQTPADPRDMPVLSLPWAAGQAWRLTAGPHSFLGGHNPSKPWSSLDLAGGDGRVRASAPGIAHLDRKICRGNWVRIDHGGGWHTSYYHLTNITVAEGQRVGRGAELGRIGTGTECGGTATGPHAHFTLWKFEGAFRMTSAQEYPLNGLRLGGYVVTEGQLPEQGCLTLTYRDAGGGAEADYTDRACQNQRITSIPRVLRVWTKDQSGWPGRDRSTFRCGERAQIFTMVNNPTATEGRLTRLVFEAGVAWGPSIYSYETNDVPLPAGAPSGFYSPFAIPPGASSGRYHATVVLTAPDGQGSVSYNVSGLFDVTC